MEILIGLGAFLLIGGLVFGFLLIVVSLVFGRGCAQAVLFTAIALFLLVLGLGFLGKAQ